MALPQAGRGTCFWEGGEIMTSKAERIIQMIKERDKERFKNLKPGSRKGSSDEWKALMEEITKEMEVNE